MEPDLEAGAPAAVPLIKRETVLACVLCVVMLAISVVAGYQISSMDVLLPTFSVEVAGLDALDVSKPASAFNVNLTLLGVSQRRLIWSRGMCLERGTVAVTYGGAMLAWGHVPEFCVPAHARKDVRVVAHGAGMAMMSRELRDRLASERLSRAAELDVDMTLDPWRVLSCRVKLDQPSPQQPSPCKILAI